MFVSRGRNQGFELGFGALLDVDQFHFLFLSKLIFGGLLLRICFLFRKPAGREWDTQEISMSVISLSGTVDEDDGIFSLYWR